MKKHFILIFLLCLNFFTWAQRTTYSNANRVNNGTFSTNLNDWTTTSSTWIVDNGTAFVYGNATGELSQNVTAIPVVDGHIFLNFSVKSYWQNGNYPKLEISFSGTKYAEIQRTTNGVRFELFNNAKVNQNVGSWNNAAGTNTSDFNIIRLAIPVTASGTTSGILKFYIVAASGTSTNPHNFRLDNVDFQNVVNTLPTATSCPTCLPMVLDANGEIDYNDAPAKPECNDAEEGNSIYKYYLPAVAVMPTALDATNATSPSGIYITTEVPSANVVVYRANGTVFNTTVVTPAAMVSIPTQLEDMFTSNYTSPYNNRGFVIESDQPITVRWGLQHVYNRESVVLRGKHAVGKSFRGASIMGANRSTATTSSEGNHYMTVMALENNTKVQIAKTSEAINSTDFTFVILNKGQQYTVVNNTVPMSGRLVLSDKDIVVASGQQHKRIMSIDSAIETSTSLEGTVLQIPPTYMLGKEYVVLTTEGYFGFQVIANSNGTTVYKDGVAIRYLNAGESYQYFNKTNTADLFGKPTTISLSKPGYVYNIGSNEIGEFELFPAPPLDLPVGKAGKIIYSSERGNNGWVIVDEVDANKLKLNNSATLNATNNWVLPARNGVNAKKVFYWNNTFTPNTTNEITCEGCNVMYVGQLNDGGTAGAQIGYITSFDASSIQFFNTGYLPIELLTNGYIFDTLNYFYGNPGTISHTLTIASSGGNVTIDSIGLSRISGHPDAGSVNQISGTTFTLNTPATASVQPRVNDTIVTTIYVQDAAHNVAALCLSYILTRINPLPVELLNFEANKHGAQGLLSWTTGKEVDNKGFSIERSVDGKSWESLGFVNSKNANGIADIKNDYQFVDELPHSGDNLYRLKQEDYNGTFEYSIIRKLYFDNLNNNIIIYPNPTTNILHIKGLDGNEKISVYNALSQLVDNIYESGNREIKLEMGKFAAGVYLIQIVKSDNSILNFKIIKE